MAPDLALHISSTPDFSFVKVLVQDLLFKYFPKSNDLFRRQYKMCNVMCNAFI